MFGNSIAFDQPWFLLLLLLLPLFWVASYRSLSGLGQFRRFCSLSLRTLVVLLVILALAEFQMVRTSDQLTVLFVLDQSESIPRDKRQYMLDYVVKEVDEHRKTETSDRAGVIVFGGEAKIEIPPIDMSLPSIGRFESVVDLHPEITSLESALELAKASFPEDTARRLVIVTDGNENLGDASRVARTLAEDGIGIDVVPVRLPKHNEISIDKVVVPSNLRQGQSFEAKVVLQNQRVNPEDNSTTQGTLRLIEKSSGQSRVIAEETVSLQPGTNVVGFKHQIDQTAMLTYEATFIPEDDEADFRTQNNESSAYTHVRGKGRVLLIEDGENIGEFDELVRRLRRQNMEVSVMNSLSLFSSAEQLLEFDCIVLANLPRSSGEPNEEGEFQVESFSDAQIEMLVSNTEELGSGLVMLGGDRAFGVGGWSNTRLEEAMPVDFQVKNDRIEAVGALAMVMHATEMPEGNYWQKIIGYEAIQALGPMDYCGVVVWNDFGGGTKWLWGQQQGGMLRVGPAKKAMLSAVGKMVPGDMPDFDNSMQRALNGLTGVKASVKHMIIISDGDPSGPAPNLLSQYIQQNIVISTVAVGTHGPPTKTPLQRIATATGGKFYNVTNPKALPKIFQREARKVAKPLIVEQPQINVLPVGSAAAHPTLQGLPINALPPIKGYVATTIKPSGLVEQLLIASEPPDAGENSTIFATWQFGLGRSTVITTDAGYRWAADWQRSEYYDRFYAQVIRHAMRPVNESANFSVASQIRDGRVVLTVNALTGEDEFLNNLPMLARGISPELEGFDIDFRQVSPGRYEASFDATDSGSYLFSILPGDGYERLAGGISVPVSSEFMDQETNWPLLETLTSFPPVGGQPGEIIDGDVTPVEFQNMLANHDTFRHDLAKSTSIRDIWPWVLVLCGALFFTDVLVRRVLVDPTEWIERLYRRFKPATDHQQEVRQSRLDRLKNQKVALKREQDQATRRYTAPTPQEDASSMNDLDQNLDSPLPQKQPRRETKKPDMDSSTPSMSYTERLLQAKKRAASDKKDSNDTKGQG